MRLWDIGVDTERMAKVLEIPQHDAERFLHEGLNSRRRARERTTYVSEDSGLT